MIKLVDVNKSFIDEKKEVHAVRNVNLEISKGDIFGIVGLSGAGKSTLIRLLNRLETTDRGEILIDEVDITKLGKNELRQFRMQCGMIFQHFNLLWSRTVIDNIMLPLEIAGVKRSERVERAKELIELVGLSEKENVYPSELSGGQKQRVGIARALANNPKILLCDEATSALDPKTTDSILTLLKDINKKLGITIVLITHEMDVIRKICNRVSVMSDGEVVEDGLVKEIFNHPKHPITKEFVKNDVLEAEHALDTGFKLNENKKLIKLIFSDDSAKNPILNNLIIKYQLKPSIVEAQIKSVQESQIGFMIIEIDEDFDLTEVREYLEKEHVEIEEGNHVR
jgi:D-methionine transport system ATP-binding protein